MKKNSCPRCRVSKEKAVIQNESIEVAGAIFLYGTAKALLMFIFNFLVLFAVSSTAVMSSRREKRLSDKLNELLGTPEKWKVRSINLEELNAFTFGGNNLYITRPLMVHLNEREIIAILLHEAGHSQEWHVLKRISTHSILCGMLFSLALFIVPTSVALAITFYVMARIVNSFVVETYLARLQEYEADDFAVDQGYGEDFASSLKKLAKFYDIDLRECKTKECKSARKMDEIFSSHPDIRDRIENALKKAKSIDDVKKILVELMKHCAAIIKREKD